MIPELQWAGLAPGCLDSNSSHIGHVTSWMTHSACTGLLDYMNQSPGPMIRIKTESFPQAMRLIKGSDRLWEGQCWHAESRLCQLCSLSAPYLVQGLASLGAALTCVHFLFPLEGLKPEKPQSLGLSFTTHATFPLRRGDQKKES